MRFGELGDGGCGLPRALCALAMTGGLQGVRYRISGRTEASAPTEGNKKCGAYWAGRCGERTERCQWQRERSERVAAVKISSVRRKAAQKFWAPQQGHRPLRKRILWCVGEGLSCPPSCQPTDGHCRTRQSGHFLETGSLLPPLAALRRFPLPRATARVAPTKALQGVRGKWRIYRGLPGEGQRGGNFWLNWGEGREVF